MPNITATSSPPEPCQQIVMAGPVSDQQKNARTCRFSTIQGAAAMAFRMRSARLPGMPPGDLAEERGGQRPKAEKDDQKIGDPADERNEVEDQQDD